MKKAWNIIMDVLGVKRSWDHPDEVKVPDLRYRNKVREAFWLAASRLSASQIFTGHEHDIRRVKIAKGTVLRPDGWAIPDGNGGCMGAWKGSKVIGLVVNPQTGEMNANALGDLAHEWGHAFMDKANMRKGDVAGQHELLGKAGL